MRTVRTAVSDSASHLIFTPRRDYSPFARDTFAGIENPVSAQNRWNGAAGFGERAGLT